MEQAWGFWQKKDLYIRTRSKQICLELLTALLNQYDSIVQLQMMRKIWILRDLGKLMTSIHTKDDSFGV